MAEPEEAPGPTVTVESGLSIPDCHSNHFRHRLPSNHTSPYDPGSAFAERSQVRMAGEREVPDAADT